jgi:predicted hotdog family 3-hydroxylacyl-ACP dehydratase
MSVLSRSDIARCLPHGAGMQLIDQVIRYDDKEILCLTQSHRRRDHPLSVEEQLPLTAMIEYAAQAAGLHFALSRSSDVAAPVAGYIGALKGVHFYPEVGVGDELAIVATPLVREQKMAIYHFVISTDDRRLAEGRISLAQT